jgi:MFS family permease
MTSDIGAIVGPVLTGVLADRLGYGWAFGVTGGVLVLAAAAWTVTPESLKSKA